MPYLQQWRRSNHRGGLDMFLLLPLLAACCLLLAACCCCCCCCCCFLSQASLVVAMLLGVLLVPVVTRAKLCWDFSATVYILHLGCAFFLVWLFGRDRTIFTC
jgi:hypothetical protein